MPTKYKIAVAAIISISVAGCSSKYTVFANSEHLCRDWGHQTVSKSDKITEPTASQIEANNKSRPNWGCMYGENRAAS